jgi:hypothetical protein
VDFPTGTDFPDNGNQIPDGHEYEGFYWDAAAGVWRRICADPTKFPPVIISPEEPEYHIDSNGDQDTTYPVSAGDLWFDEDQKILYVAGEDTADNLVWIISTPADRSVLQEEGNTTFTFPSGRNGARADDRATVYNDVSELWYIYNADKNQWIDLPPGVNTLSMQAILLRGPDDMDETFEFNQTDRDLYDTEALCYVNADDHDAFTRIVIPHVDTEGFAWDGLLQLIEEGDQLTLLQKDPTDPNTTVTQRSDFLTVGQETINSESYNTEIEYDSEQPDHTPYFGEPVVFRFKALVNVPNDREVYYQENPPTLNDNPGLSEGNLWIDSNTNLEYVWNGSYWEPISEEHTYVNCVDYVYPKFLRNARYRKPSHPVYTDMMMPDVQSTNPNDWSKITFGPQLDFSDIRVGGRFQITAGGNVDTWTCKGIKRPKKVAGYDRFWEFEVEAVQLTTAPGAFFFSDNPDQFYPVHVLLPGVDGPCLKCDENEEETICEEIQNVKNQIIELEEEIDAIAPSVERGFWTMNLLGTVANQGQMSLYDDDYTSVGNPTGLFKDVKSIWLNERDNAGTPHGFAGVEAGELIELFVQGADDYGLYEVVDIHDETNGAAQWWVIEVTFVRTLEDASTTSTGDIIRVKIFNAPEGGSADEFVLKEGDDMTGRLSMEQTAELENFLIPQAKTQPNIRFKATKPGSTTSTFVSLYQPGYKTALACSAAFYATTLITKNYLYGCVDDFASDGRIIRDIKNASVSFLRPDDNDTDKDIGSLNFSSDSKLTWGKDRIEILKPVGHNVNATGFKIRGTRPLLPGGSDVFDNNGDIFRVKHVNNEADFIEYLGQIKDSACLVNKGYVDDAISNATGSALVDVRTNNPSNPDIGHMWYNKSTNQLLLRIS